jgi:signal peptidase II
VWKNKNLLLRRVVPVMLGVLLLATDQFSKQWVMARLRTEGAFLVLPGPIDLTLVFNHSNAFGLVPVSGEMTRWSLAAVNLVVALVLGGVVLWRPPSLPVSAGLACIAAGAAGNAIDRIRDGSVIDFLDAGKLGFVWVFNIADVSVDLGVGMILADSFLRRRARAT